MKINTVGILGAGAVGAYFITGLQEKLGDNLWIIAEGQRRERLERESILVNGQRLKLNIRSPKEARGVDLLLVMVKYGALRSSLDEIEQITAPHTIVMSLMNGVDSEEIIGERIGKEHMVYSMMRIASERRGNEITFDWEATQGAFFGAVDQPGSQEKVAAVAELLQNTGVRYTICEDIIQDIWYKYALNICKNLPQAMVGCGYGAYKTSRYVIDISEKLLDETIAVAAARGIDISDKSRTAASNSGVLDTARFSTLQDLDAKRHTEIDMFSGALVRMGQELGIPTPYNEFTYNMIRALEEKNDGLLP